MLKFITTKSERGICLNREIIDLQTKRLEKELAQLREQIPRLSAQAADAADLLIALQQGLEELYVSIPDVEPPDM